MQTNVHLEREASLLKAWITLEINLRWRQGESAEGVGNGILCSFDLNGYRRKNNDILLEPPEQAWDLDLSALLWISGKKAIQNDTSRLYKPIFCYYNKMSEAGYFIKNRGLFSSQS